MKDKKQRQRQSPHQPNQCRDCSAGCRNLSPPGTFQMILYNYRDGEDDDPDDDDDDGEDNDGGADGDGDQY